MPPGRGEPVCGQCGTKNSTIWHKTDPDDPLNAPLCSSCHAHQSPSLPGTTAVAPPPLASTSGGLAGQDGESSQEPGSPGQGTASNAVVDMIRSETFGEFGRRSRDRTPELGAERVFKKDKNNTPARKNTRSRGKQLSAKFTSTKGRSRRIIFKNRPLKGPTAFATPVTSDNIFHRGMYLQVGDIVQIIDEEDELPYYAQIRGFLQDQYCVKSAAISWLLPLKELADRWTFNPADFYLGQSEEFPRSLDCMEFVMHAPSDYYRPAAAPYPISRPTVLPDNNTSKVDTQTPKEMAVERHLRKTGHGCVWTSLGPRIMTRREWEGFEWESLPSHPLPTSDPSTNISKEPSLEPKPGPSTE